MIKRTGNQANIRKFNSCMSIINIADNILLDIEYNVINMEKSFNFYINTLLNDHKLRFEEVRGIVKAFYTNNFTLLVSLLNDLKNKAKAYIKSFY